MSDHLQCAQCKDTGVFPPRRGTAVCSCRAPVNGLDDACTLLVARMRDFDPTYRMRIDGVLEERHLTATQLCARFFSYVLRNSLQNEPVDDLLFQEGPTAVTVTQCEWCHKHLDPQWPGQKYHPQPCTQQAREAGLLPASKSARPPQPKPKPAPAVEESPGLSAEEIERQMQELGEL